MKKLLPVVESSPGGVGGESSSIAMDGTVRDVIFEERSPLIDCNDRTVS